MSKSLPQPCARWADLLAARTDTLSAAERRALDAHVAHCRACAAVRADYQRMDARIRSLPNPRIRPDLPPWLLALQAAQTRDAPAPQLMTPLHSLENHMQTRNKPGMPIPAPTPISQGRAARRRVVSWVTAVAALVVIALITTALLVSHAGKPGNTGGPKNNTATPSSSQGWTPVAGLDHLSAQPIIAPSNPKVIYLQGPNPATLQRSDDSGGHWRHVSAPPQASQAQDAVFMVSASNAQNIFLALTFDHTSSICTGGQASAGAVNAYSGGSCTIPYYSTDGGEHWGLMRCVTCAQAVGAGSLAAVGEIISQGNHLYSLIFDQNQVRRLITSTDGGATWRFADGTLIPKGLGICGFGAAPTGTTVFALVQTGYCSQPVGYVNGAATQPEASGLAIWRSNDAGAHWSRVSNFTYQLPDTAVFRAIDTGGAQPTLIAAAGQAATYQRLMSTDGGKTWQPLPTQGLPDTADIFTPQTALSDGSLLTEVQTVYSGPTTFYALNPGSQIWRQITPTLDNDSTELVVTSTGGNDTFWAVTTDHQGSFSVLVYTLK
ncbi:MAG TPA: hypothetical protein VFU69_07710 [Ktedonobacterales bacterium]|nr:hypothetical protein [Ktedonobacterales bacterium]